jgi:N-acetylneuraminate synthase
MSYLTNSQLKSIGFKQLGKNVKIGEAVTLENVRAIRPGGGCSPKLIDGMLGKKFLGDFLTGTPMPPDLIGTID